jgi:hypothetical protein
MKKIFTLLSTLCLGFGLNAQQISNGGFETWSTATKADGWGTITNALKVAIPAAPSIGLETKDSMPNVKSGTYSMRITTDSIPTGPSSKALFSGVAHYGEIVYNAGLKFYNTPFTKRPDSLIFSYKYVLGPNGADTAYAGMFMSKWVTTPKDSQIVVLGIGFGLDATSTFKTVRLPLSSFYNTNDTPDSMSVEFSSSLDQPKKGSTLWVDDVMLVVPVGVGFEYISLSSSKVNVYPNPATDRIVISTQDFTKGEYVVTDVTGKVVAEGIVTKAETEVAIGQLQNGNYFYKVRNTEANVSYTGKFTVAK